MDNNNGEQEIQMQGMKFLIKVDAVSYTHLDVYKRQRLYTLGVKSRRPIKKTKLTVAMKEKRLLRVWARKYRICLLYTSRCV